MNIEKIINKCLPVVFFTTRIIRNIAPSFGAFFIGQTGQTGQASQTSLTFCILANWEGENSRLFHLKYILEWIKRKRYQGKSETFCCK